MKKSTKSRIGGAIAAAAMIPSLIGCPSATSETPAPAPLPTLKVENFDVNLELSPPLGNEHKSEWKAAVNFAVPSDTHFNGLKVESSEVSGTLAAPGKLSGTVKTAGPHTFTATPQSTAADQAVAPVSASATASDTRTEKQKVYDWIESSERRYNGNPLYDGDVNTLKGSISSNPTNADQEVQDLKTNIPGLTKATPKDKFLATQNRISKAIIKTSRVRAG